MTGSLQVPNRMLLITLLLLVVPACRFREGSGIPPGAVEREVPAHPEAGLQARMLRYYRGDELVGERRHFNDGKLFSETPLKNGTKQGLARQWHANGQIAMEVPYDQGLMHGECRQFNTTGGLLGSFKMENGSGVRRVWHENGQLKYECALRNGQQNGTCKRWYEGGAVAEVLHFVDDAENGVALAWYPDGKPLQTACYRNGHMHGELVMWDTAGKQTKEYCVRGLSVTREQYIEMMRTDATLPKPTE